MATLVCSKPYTQGGASEVRSYFIGNLRLLPFSFVPSASYTTGGDTIAAADLPGTPAQYKDLISPFAINCTPYIWKLDVGNSKLLAYGGGASTGLIAEVASTTNLTTLAGSAAITIFFLVR